MIFQEAIRLLKNGEHNKFILTGDEEFLKDYFIRALKYYRERSEFNIFGPDSQVEALDALYNEPLMGDRVIILEDYNKMKTEKFLPLISKSSDDIIMVLGAKANKKKKDITKAIGLFNEVECNKLKPYGRDFPTWIYSLFNKKSLEVEDGVVDLLYSRVGQDMFTLEKSVNKLALYCEGKVSTKNVEDVIGVVAETSSFDILEKTLSGDIKGALSALNNFERNISSFVPLAAFFTSYMEKLYRIILMRGRKFSPENIANIIGIPAFILKTKYMPLALRLGLPKIGDLFDSSCNLEVSLRMSKNKPSLLINNFLMEVVRKVNKK